MKMIITTIVLFLTSTLAMSSTLCPDGTYVTTERCQLTPKGDYIRDEGTGMRLTPKGDYIPNTGSMTLCPDGIYVAGKRCRLNPDGTYSGVN